MVDYMEFLVAEKGHFVVAATAAADDMKGESAFNL